MRRRTAMAAATSNWKEYGKYAAIAVAAGLIVWAGMALFGRGSSPPPAPPPVATVPEPAKPACPEGTKFIAEAGVCIAHVTDRAEIAKALPPDLSDDPNCVGKPAGYRYDKPVTGPDGAKGVAHIVCGTRPGG